MQLCSRVAYRTGSEYGTRAVHTLGLLVVGGGQTGQRAPFVVGIPPATRLKLVTDV